MEGSPWITVSRKEVPAVKIHNQVYRNFASQELHAQMAPSIVTLIGKREKSLVIRELLGGPDSNYPQEHHGQVHLWPDPHCQTNQMMFFADCELHTHNSSHWNTAPSWTGPGSYKRLEWSMIGKHSSKDLAALICARILAPLSHALCFFASDLNGIRGVAHLLTDHVQSHLTNDLSHLAKPHVLVVFNTSPTTASASQVEMKLMSLLKKFLSATGTYGTDVDVDALIYSCFQSIRILPVVQNTNLATRSAVIRRGFAAISKETRQIRISDRIMFNHFHFQAICKLMLTHFTQDITTPFSFINVSRPHGFSKDTLLTHLKNLLGLLPSQAWLWHLVVPLVASALLLATYPPGSHYFPPKLTFHSLYKVSCQKAIEDFASQTLVQEKFIKDVEDKFCGLFEQLIAKDGKSAKHTHLDSLHQLHMLLKDCRSQKSCFCCLLRLPEKVLDCGHAYCDTCIRTFGSRSGSEMYTFSLPQCIICSSPHSSHHFTFIPPTAGIRLLSLDGGGVRGIIPLTVLRHMESELSYLGCPLRDHFDFVAGTSSGGLIVIGIFVMKWTASECFEKFCNIAHETFGPQKKGLVPFNYVQSLLLTCLDYSQYKSLSIEAAFQSNFGPPPKMFNPLSCDTKVAVITAPVKGKITSIISNYNGEERPRDIGYCIIRASQREDDITVDEAASCTTAAPGFFKPKLLKYFGSYQDGALHHNNPAKIALWEQRFVWANKGPQDQPDFVLSIGTGTKVEKLKNGPHSPAKGGFYTRIKDAFNWNIDAERGWTDVINFTPIKFRNQYHRINLAMDTEEPQIDDVSQLDILRSRTEDSILHQPSLRSFIDNLLASMFYFQLAEVLEAEDRYQCTGYIYCRLNLPKEGRQILYEKMAGSAAYFLIDGRPLPCVRLIPRNYPPFKRQVKFTAEDLGNKLYISLRGLTEQTWQLSGLPRPIRDLIEAQGLNAAFGRSDHQRSLVTLSQIPQKRSLMYLQ